MAEKKSVLLRMSPELWQALNQWAEQEFRSLNGQIEYLLTQAVKNRQKKKEQDK
ncbi:MAG: Arc family DNA binding domain-containing protein [Acidobacteria bacterium]|nr:Arc family DNA binding domain-containing protein [Acidobacteriota bacterium]MCB9397724.1 Arc family DNA binding domain-containing protein [Acidobacteriota bacterium]